MLNIELLKKDFEKTCQKLKDRNFDTSKLDSILKMDVEIRALKTQLQELNEHRNKASATIPQLLKEQKHAEVTKIKNDVLKDKDSIVALETKISQLEKGMNDLMAFIPNLCNDNVPIGKDESANQEVKR